MKDKTAADAAWKFWQESKQALDELGELMQQLAGLIVASPAIQPPPILVRQIKRDMARFQEQFTLLIREQKRKAAR
jgi:UDP-N-acetylmuramoylalanine-D-glutamate ligase